MSKMRLIIKTFLFLILACATCLGALIVWRLMEGLPHKPIYRTAASIDDFMQAFEDYYLSFGSYPKPGYSGSAEAVSNIIWSSVRLNPIDGFGHPLIYTCSNDGQTYVLCSTGKDGKLEKPIRLTGIEGLQVTDLNDDVIVSNGEFYRWWEGLGTSGSHFSNLHLLYVNEHRIINDSQNYDLLLERAKIMIELGRGEATEILLDKLQNLSPKDPEPSFILACHYLGASAKEFDKAIEALNKAIELKPDHAEFWKMRGWAYLYLRSFPKAADEFRQAIRLKPSLKNQQKQEIWDFLSFCKLTQEQKAEFMRSGGFQP